MLKLSRFNFSQQYLDYGYKELTIPAVPGGKHLLETNALHIWPRGNYMLIALPNVDGTFACILFLPFEGPDSFAQLTTPTAVTEFVGLRFPDAIALMPDLAGNFFANPTGAMVTVKCSPWHVGGRALLLGDAAHAIVPSLTGNQLCFATAPPVGLARSRGADWARCSVNSRGPSQHRCDRNRQLRTPVEMRDRVADPRFLFRKKVELALRRNILSALCPSMRW
jgi:kynurenine 3-monooxygenase